MYANYRWKLFFVLLIFAIVVTFTVAIFDYLRLKEEIRNDNEIEIENAEKDSIDALYTIEKIYKLIDPEISEQMEEATDYLLNLYDEEPDFNTWDFNKLAKELQMDIYIINEENVVEYSNVDEEIGLDFTQCCKKLSEKLDNRRASGELHIDEIDVNQNNDQIKKFSYKATEDKQYLIELGYNLEKEEAFREFNFIDKIEEIVEKSSIIEAIHILNFGGKAYGALPSNPDPDNRYEAFSEVRETNEPKTIETNYAGKELKAKYIPFHSPYDDSATTFKVVEILYNDNGKNPYIATNFQQLIIQLFIIIIFSLIVATLIASWFSKPIYYAYHDSLTKLKNRTAFNQVLHEAFLEEEKQYALFILDLDNFKLVNDQLGHATGDELLKNIGEKLESICHGDAFRLGGDEFAIIREIDEDFQLKDKAEFVLQSLNETINEHEEIRNLSVSVSVGIASANSGCNKEWLFNQADKALYEAKRLGKNQYHINQHNNQAIM